MDLFKQFYINEDQAKNGIWETVGDAKFLIAHVGNITYKKRFAEELRKRKLNNPEAKGYQEKLIDCTLDIYAETILLDWKGVTFKGKKLEYSRDAAKEMLRIDGFFDLIHRIASTRSNYQSEIEGQAEKNSSKRSGGKSVSARTSKN